MAFIIVWYSLLPLSYLRGAYISILCLAYPLDLGNSHIFSSFLLFIYMYLFTHSLKASYKTSSSQKETHTQKHYLLTLLNQRIMILRRAWIAKLVFFSMTVVEVLSKQHFGTIPSHFPVSCLILSSRRGPNPCVYRVTTPALHLQQDALTCAWVNPKYFQRWCSHMLLIESTLV